MNRIIVCKDCGKEKEHCAKGLCEKCYMYQYREPRRKELAGYSRLYYENHREERVRFQRKWREEHREEHRSYSRKWGREHPEHVKNAAHHYYQENREEILLRTQQWALDNPEKVLKSKRLYRENNRKKCLEATRCWGRENPEKRNTITRRYRARKTMLPDTLTIEEARFKLLIGSCFYCRGRVDLELDHFVPLRAKENVACGTTLANSVVACRRCNARKGARLPNDFLVQLSLVEVM